MAIYPVYVVWLVVHERFGVDLVFCMFGYLPTKQYQLIESRSRDIQLDVCVVYMEYHSKYVSCSVYRADWVLERASGL